VEISTPGLMLTSYIKTKQHSTKSKNRRVLYREGEGFGTINNTILFQCFPDALLIFAKHWSPLLAYCSNNSPQKINDFRKFHICVPSIISP